MMRRLRLRAPRGESDAISSSTWLTPALIGKDERIVFGLQPGLGLGAAFIDPEICLETVHQPPQRGPQHRCSADRQR